MNSLLHNWNKSSSQGIKLKICWSLRIRFKGPPNISGNRQASGSVKFCRDQV